jgi:hypothetical protein
MPIFIVGVTIGKANKQMAVCSHTAMALNMPILKMMIKISWEVHVKHY